MIDIYDADSGQLLGTITKSQLQFLIDQMEEEDSSDQDYYINQATVDMFEERNCPKELVAFLRKALGNREEMDIRWERE